MISERIVEWNRTLAQFTDIWNRVVTFRKPRQPILSGYEGIDPKRGNINHRQIEIAQQVSRAYIPPVPANR